MPPLDLLGSLPDFSYGGSVAGGHKTQRARSTPVVVALVLIVQLSGGAQAFGAVDTGSSGGADFPRFVDVPSDHLFVESIEWLADQGITRGCNPPDNTRFCPDDFVTRGQMAAFLVRALAYVEDGGGDLFVDDNSSIFENDIDKLGTAGVTKGCDPPDNTRFCPDDFVTRGQMAAFLVRALGYTDTGGGDLFFDDNGSTFETDIDKLGTAGVTKGCNPPANDRFCPEDVVTRGQMAAFLWRAFGQPDIGQPGLNRIDTSTTTVLATADIDTGSVASAGSATVVLSSEARIPSVGRLVVHPGSPALPTGLIGRVVAVSGRTITTTWVPMNEVMPEASFASSTSLGLEAAAMGAGTEGVVGTAADSSCKGAGGSATDVDLSNPRMDGDLYISPSWSPFSDGVTVEMRFDYHLGFDYALSGSLIGSCRYQFFPQDLELGVIPTPPPLPPLFLEGNIFVRMGGTVDEIFIDGQVGLDGHVGVHYSDSLGSPFANADLTTTAVPSFGSDDTQITIDAGIELSTKFTGVAGPYADAGPYFDYTLHKLPNCPPWETEIGGQLALGLALEIYGFDLVWEIANWRPEFLRQPGLKGACDPVDIVTTSLPDGVVGVEYDTTLQAAGGVPPYNWSLASGVLPAGISLNTDGSLSGTPTTPGESSFEVEVVGAQGSTDSAAFTISIEQNLFSSCSAQNSIPASECEALLALYALTGGDSWTTNSGWKVDPNPCNWYGVTCSSGHVSEIVLESNGLTGELPLELGNLSELTLFDASGNQLSGSVPSELGGLQNLGVIDLPANSLSGAIPPELGSLTNLHYLSLANNDLSGPIPPELGNLSELQTLWLPHNSLSGSIPPELGNLPELKDLALLNNQLTGSIPPELGSLQNLTQLRLAFNQLSGSIPPELGNLPSLNELNVSFNELTGSIPAELGSITNLMHLFIHNNALTGSLPPELGNLSNLIVFEASTNQLSEAIPSELGNLTSLEQFGVGGNSLTGEIAPEFGALSNLKFLHLHDNQLTGSIPTELGNLNNLESLLIQNNSLSGSIPPELGNLTNLITLAASENDLSGSIPSELGDLGALRSLSLDNNLLSGSIPTELATLNNLNSLGVSGNQLTGSIPPELGNLTALEFLALSANGLSGSIPGELGNLTNLTWLDLALNDLTGSIPVEFGNLTSLETLNLNVNQLSGSIPVELGNLENLEFFEAGGGNQLTGPIPTELGDLTNLIDLALGGNLLSGSIPPELGNLANLKVLSLVGNDLDGQIPQELGNLTELGSLTLNDNALSGPVPESLMNLTNLIQLLLNGQSGCLTASDPDLVAFIESFDPNWDDGCEQTMP